MTQQNISVTEVAEAVVIVEAVSGYMNRIADEYPDHDDQTYVAAMSFIKFVYSKYKRIADTRIDVDAFGNYIIRRERGKFDLN